MNNPVLTTLGIVHRIYPNVLKSIHVKIEKELAIVSTQYVLDINGEEHTYGHAYPINGDEYGYKMFIEKCYTSFLTSLVKKPTII